MERRHPLRPVSDRQRYGDTVNETLAEHQHWQYHQEIAYHGALCMYAGEVLHGCRTKAYKQHGQRAGQKGINEDIDEKIVRQVALADCQEATGKKYRLANHVKRVDA